MKWNEAARLLDDCEKALRKLVAEAAGDGDYASVVRITDWAKALSALVSESHSVSPIPTTGDAQASSGAGNKGKSNGIPSEIRAQDSERKPRRASDLYPKFFRRGSELVKVGWSKKDRNEYHHRAPRRAIDAVTVAVRQVGARGRLFSGDALLPLKSPVDGAVLPDYQAYVALAWLKHLGLVEQRGRRSGYTLAREKQMDSTITAAWPSLSEWRG